MKPWEIIKCAKCGTTTPVRQVIPFGWVKVRYNYLCKDCSKKIDN